MGRSSRPGAGPRLRFPTRSPWIRFALALGVVVACWVGWRTFWFLTDDAFIAFRYVSNSMLGYGLVWNPPPFRPVEGYTSFLWVELLQLVWRVAGVAPPAAANWLSLAFGLGTLFLAYRFLERMALPGPLARHRTAMLALVMLGVVTNRTFLTWLSSGLETSLFNFLLTWWIYAALTPREQRSGPWILRFSLIAAAVALARPDGLLFCGAFLALLALHLWERRARGGEWLRGIAWATPLLLVPIHLLWRRSTYGDWLPNTFYAKYVEPWPESGVRYLLSFLVEYGVWVWLLLAGTSCLVLLRRSWLRPGPSFRSHYPLLITLAALLGHFAYYTFVIGGDHFEYRVYSHLVPLLFLSAVWLASRLSGRPRVVVGWLAAFVLCSWPIPWVHWRETHALETRAQTHVLAQPIAPHFPRWVRPVVEAWDGWQAWLIRRHVGNRHQEHKVLYQEQLRIWPSREVGSRIRWAERAVLPSRVVGMVSWVFPEVAVIDVYGLNDRVIARNPAPRQEIRRMAHERVPPPGYVACFRPNARIAKGQLRFVPRKPPLSDEEIRACEARDWR